MLPVTSHERQAVEAIGNMKPAIQDHEWQVRVLYKTENTFENSFFLQSQFFLLVHAHSFLMHRH